MDRIVCQWCWEQNAPDRTDCVKCGAPLDVKDRVGDPGSNVASMPPPPPPSSYQPAPSYPYPAASTPGRARGYRVWQWLWTLVFVGIVAAGVFYTTHFRNPASPTRPAQLLTVDGLTGLLAQTRNQFGDTMGYSMNVYTDSATLSRADPASAREAKAYYYQGGKWKDSGNSPLFNETVVDLSKFDTTAVIAALPGAPQKLDITHVKRTYLMISGGADGSLQLSIFVDDTGGRGGEVELNPDGSLKTVHLPS